MMTAKYLVIGSLCLFLAPLGASAGTINYEGSSTVGKFVSDATEVYSAATFVLNTKSESSGGEQCAARAKCDMGGVARELGSGFSDKGVVTTLIGHDAIAALVNADNPVTGLSAQQLNGIFTGQIVNWSEVGGADAPIKAYVVKKGSATRKVFQKVILAGADYQGTEVVTPDAKIVTLVSKDPAAIGQISLAFIKGKSGVKALDVEGQKADVENPGYPISRPLYITTKGAPAGSVKDFLDWALSAEGQQVVKQRFIGAGNAPAAAH